MGTSLFINIPNEIRPDCPNRLGYGTRWEDELPPALKDLVVPPISFDVFKEYELQADRTCGCDATNQPCYCAFRLIQTQLRSDDDEVYFEEPVYAESITSWRLLDERWLVCHTTVASFDDAAVQTRFSLSDAMPR